MDRESLIAAVNALADSTAAGETGALSAGARVTENGAEIALPDSQLRGATAITYRYAFADASTGQAGLYALAQHPAGPTIFSVRIHAANGAVDEAEIVTARQGEASIVRPEGLVAPSPMMDEIVPEPRRTPRARMIEIADSYFEAIEQTDGSLAPFAEGCNRYENGARTTNQSQGPFALGCREGMILFDYIRPIRERRYPLVDEERGLVWAIVVFDIRGGPHRVEHNGQVLLDRVVPPRSIIIGELFKINGGEIQRIEVVMRNTPLGATAGWPAT